MKITEGILGGGFHILYFHPLFSFGGRLIYKPSNLTEFRYLSGWVWQHQPPKQLRIFVASRGIPEATKSRFGLSTGRSRPLGGGGGNSNIVSFQSLNLGGMIQVN